MPTYFQQLTIQASFVLLTIVLGAGTIYWALRLRSIDAARMEDKFFEAKRNDLRVRIQFKRTQSVNLDPNEVIFDSWEGVIGEKNVLTKYGTLAYLPFIDSNRKEQSRSIRLDEIKRIDYVVFGTRSTNV